MAHTNQLLGAGSYILFQSGLLANVEDFDGPSASRDAIATTHMATTGGETFIPAATYDGGELSCNIQFDSDNATSLPQVMTAAAETVTLIFGASAATSADNFSFSGFATGFGLSGATKDLIKANITIKVSGTITHTTVA